MVRNKYNACAVTVGEGDLAMLNTQRQLMVEEILLVGALRALILELLPRLLMS